MTILGYVFIFTTLEKLTKDPFQRQADYNRKSVAAKHRYKGLVFGVFSLE